MSLIDSRQREELKWGADLEGVGKLVWFIFQETKSGHVLKGCIKKREDRDKRE